MKEKGKKLIIPPKKPLDSDICIICASSCKPKLDKHNRPYIKCAFCGSVVFFKSDMGKVGWNLVTAVIKKNFRAHKELLNAQYQKYLKENSDDELLEMT